MIDDTTVNAIILRLKTGEVLAYPASPTWQNDAAIYKITSVLNEKVLDVSDWGTDNGVLIQQYRYHGGAINIGGLFRS